MDREQFLSKESAGLSVLLLISVFVIATCGLIYELIAGTIASYLLGDSITQFSTVIGTYLFSMGIGSYLSKFLERNLVSWFVRIEILIGVIGGSSAALLFLLFGHIEYFRIVLYFIVVITGLFVGIEIPLLMTILRTRYEFRDLVSRVFSFDYIGALFASLVFPLILVPHLGLIRTSFLFGSVNVAVALWVCLRWGHQNRMVWMLKSSAIVALAFLISGFVFAERIQKFSEIHLYPGRIVYSRTTPYQRIILTSDRDEMRLYLNGNLQFSSRDEYRYHESLVHPAMLAHHSPARVLILGGGDGLACREVCKYPGVKDIFVVDLDPEMTKIFTENENLRELNNRSFSDPRVHITNSDAFLWLKQDTAKFDVIIIDFPDPSNHSLGKLYSLTFYEEVIRHLSENGTCAIQSTSPLYARKSFWCISHTCEAAGLAVTPYHSYVPSFGEWGFILAGHRPVYLPFISNAIPLSFLSDSVWHGMNLFPEDMSEVSTEINRLNNQILIQYFEEEWRVYE